MPKCEKEHPINPCYISVFCHNFFFLLSIVHKQRVLHTRSVLVRNINRQSHWTGCYGAAIIILWHNERAESTRWEREEKKKKIQGSAPTTVQYTWQQKPKGPKVTRTQSNIDWCQTLCCCCCCCKWFCCHAKRYTHTHSAIGEQGDGEREWRCHVNKYGKRFNALLSHRTRSRLLYSLLCL